MARGQPSWQQACLLNRFLPPATTSFCGIQIVLSAGIRSEPRQVCFLCLSSTGCLRRVCCPPVVDYSAIPPGSDAYLWTGVRVNCGPMQFGKWPCQSRLSWYCEFETLLPKAESNGGFAICRVRWACDKPGRPLCIKTEKYLHSRMAYITINREKNS